ncbi:hypothetical protein [Scytonema sp. NUACC26]|uniref:hypothetical protein n=1 Tax=Scytonema sp. NUACC26 TaxID=3140176 RepID=UPI0034DC56A0
MKDNQPEQLFTELDPVFEEISDDKSASITGGARANIAGRIPRVGSTTFPTVYTTTSEFNDISIRLTENPYDVNVKAVRADGTGDVSSYVRTIPANYHGVVTVAADVRDGTRFKLDFDASTLNYFDIAGRITY